MHTRRSSLFTAIIPSLVTALVILILWQIGAWHLQDKPYLLPSPWAVFRAAIRGHAQILSATWLTGRCALVGFLGCVVLGTTIGVVFAHSNFLRRGLYPYAVFLQTVPIIAVAPLIINWLGPGFASMVVVVTVIGIFPIIANVTEGVVSVDPMLRQLFTVYGASRWQTLVKLEFPFLVPYLLTGARTSGGLCVIGAIVGEFFAGYSTHHHGLGFLIPQRIQWMKTDEAFAAVLAATALGLTIFGVISWLRDKLLIRWCQR